VGSGSEKWTRGRRGPQRSGANIKIYRLAAVTEGCAEGSVINHSTGTAGSIKARSDEAQGCLAGAGPARHLSQGQTRVVFAA
jgi:hypothetical protein